jgi:chromate transporter
VGAVWGQLLTIGVAGLVGAGSAAGLVVVAAAVDREQRIGFAGSSGRLFFAPAVLVVVGVLPFRDLLRRRIGVRAVFTGTNAGVVGLQVAALIDPIWPAAILTLADALTAALALLALVRWRVSPWWVVTGCAAVASLAAWL